MVDSSFQITAGYSKSNGAFGSVDHSLDSSFNFAEPIFPGSDGRLSAEFAVTVQQELKFGMYDTSILNVGSPMSLPYVRGEIYDSSASCTSSNDTSINFLLELGFDVSVEWILLRVKLYRENPYAKVPLVHAKNSDFCDPSNHDIDGNSGQYDNDQITYFGNSCSAMNRTTSSEKMLSTSSIQPTHELKIKLVLNCKLFLLHKKQMETHVKHKVVVVVVVAR